MIVRHVNGSDLAYKSWDELTQSERDEIKGWRGWNGFEIEGFLWRKTDKPNRGPHPGCYWLATQTMIA